MNQPTNQEIHQANAKHALYLRWAMDKGNKTKLADYKRGYVIYKGVK